MEQRDNPQYLMNRKQCSATGWSTLIYSLIINICVIGYIIVHAIILYFSHLTDGLVSDADLNRIMESGIGYFIAIIIGIILLLAWKKPAYIRDTVLKPGRAMNVKTFLMLLVVFLSSQLVFGYAISFLESLLNSFGYSIQAGIDSATGSTESFTMFLYLALGAPISEELLFRGLVIRTLEPMGKKFAILCSALLFGLYHGNVLQIPFAILVGIVLGYTAVEYNIGWAMVLHTFNNLILGDTIGRLLPGIAGTVLRGLVIVGAFIAGVIVLIIHWGKIRDYIKEQVDQPMCYRSFFCSPGVIALIIFTVFSSVYMLINMVSPINS